MKKTTLGFAVAVLVGLSSFSVPAGAMPMPQVSAASSEIIQARYYHRHRHAHYHHRKVCTVRSVVTRGLYGRRIVKRVRVCR